MDNIKSRRSRRAFLEKRIPDEIIEEIIEAGRYAPSALNKQPWKFIVVANKDVIKRLSSIVKYKVSKIVKLLPLLQIFNATLRDPQTIGAIKKTVSGEDDTVFYNAPLLILIASDKSGRFASKDCALASQNMMLYAHSIGIGSCFIGRADFLMGDKTARQILGLLPSRVIQSAIVFGYTPQVSDKQPTAPNRRKDNVIKWVR